MQVVEIMGPKKKSNHSDRVVESVQSLAHMFENQMQIIQRSNAELLKNLSVNLSSTVAELSSQVLSDINDLKSVVVTDRMLDSSTVNGDVRGFIRENGTSLTQELPVRNANYIAAYKDLGGTSLVFDPGESTIHPVSFIQNLEAALDDAGVPSGKRVRFAQKSLRGSVADWAHIKKDSFTSFDVFKNLFIARYWNTEKQRKVFLRLKYGEYTGESRADYFIKLVKEASYLNNDFSEVELIRMLASHFPFEIKRSILNAACRNVDEIEQYLREVDELHASQNSRSNNSNWRSNTSVNNNYNYRGQNSNRTTSVNQNNTNNGARPREGGNMPTVNNSNNQQDNLNTVVHINKKNSLLACPTIKISINKQNYSALVDTGSEITAISSEFYDYLLATDKNVSFPVLPVNSVNITTADGGKKLKITKQMFLKFIIENSTFEIPCLIIKNLACDMLVGIDFLSKYKCNINCYSNMLSFDDNKLLVPFKTNSDINNSLLLCLVDTDDREPENEIVIIKINYK